MTHITRSGKEGDLTAPLNAPLHTLEPWHVQPHQLSHGKQEVIVGADRSEILALMECGRESDKLNARRIVAAINACKGIETEVLEQFPLGGIQQSLQLFAIDSAVAQSARK